MRSRAFSPPPLPRHGYYCPKFIPPPYGIRVRRRKHLSRARSRGIWASPTDHMPCDIQLSREGTAFSRFSIGEESYYPRECSVETIPNPYELNGHLAPPLPLSSLPLSRLQKNNLLLLLIVATLNPPPPPLARSRGGGGVGQRFNEAHRKKNVV